MLGIFIIALCLRLCFGLFHAPRPLADIDGYLRLAKSLSKQVGLSFHKGAPTSQRPPLYPLFLATLILNSRDIDRAVIIWQSMLGAASAVIIFMAVRLILPFIYSIIAGLIAAVYPFFIYYSSRILTETLTIFLLSLLALVYLIMLKEAMEKQRLDILYLVLTGWICALLALTRSNLFMLVLLVPLDLFLKRRYLKGRVAVSIAIFLISFSMLYSPWVWYNYRVHHRLILTNTNGGYTFLEGNNPEFYQNMVARFPKAPRWEKDDWEDWRARIFNQTALLDEASRSDYFYAMAFDYIKEHPFCFVHSTFVKAIWFISPFIKSNDTKLSIIGFIAYSPLLVLMVIGLLSWLRGISKRGGSASASIYDHYSLFMVIFIANWGLCALYWSQMRYRTSLMPLGMMIAMAGLRVCMKRISATRDR